MKIVRELPPEYLENCPTIDEKYKVLFKLGTGRFSKYSIFYLEWEWLFAWLQARE